MASLQNINWDELNQDEIDDLLLNFSKSGQLNLSDTPLPWDNSTEARAAKIVAYVILMLTSLVLNCLVIGVVTCTQNLRTRFNLFMVNLAVADLLTVFCCMWVHLVHNLVGQWPFNAAMCKINTFAQVLVLSVSIFTLTTTVIDRFLATVQPRHLGLTQRFQGGVIGLTWTSGLLLAFPYLIYMQMNEFEWIGGHEKQCLPMFPFETSQRFYITFFAAVAYVVPVCIMSTLLTVTYVKMRRDDCATRGQNERGRNGASRFRQVCVGRCRCIDSALPDNSRTVRESENVEGNSRNAGGRDSTSNASSTDVHSDTVGEGSVGPQRRESVLSPDLLAAVADARRKAVSMTLVVLVTFVLCWTPQQVTLLWDIYREPSSPKPPFIYAFKYAALFLAFSTSAVNPAIFIAFNPCFRHATRQLLRGNRRRNSVFTITPAELPSPASGSAWQSSQLDSPV